MADVCGPYRVPFRHQKQCKNQVLHLEIQTVVQLFFDEVQILGQKEHAFVRIELDDFRRPRHRHKLTQICLVVGAI